MMTSIYLSRRHWFSICQWNFKGKMLIILFTLCQDWKKCQQCQPGHKSAPCRLPEILRPTLLCPCAPWASGHWEIYNWEIIENNNWRSLGGYEQALWWTRWLHACPSSLKISFHDKEEDWMFVCVNLSLLHLTVFTSLAAPRPRDQRRT